MAIEAINNNAFNVNYLKDMKRNISYNQNSTNVSLFNSPMERSPQTDTLSFKAKSNFQEVSDKDLAIVDEQVKGSTPAWYDITKKHTVKGNGIDVNVKDGLSGRNVVGNICNQDVNLTISNSGLDLAKGKITGTINGQNVKLKYQATKNGLAIDGLQQSDSDLLTRLALIVSSKIYDDIKTDSDMAAAAIITGSI